MGTDNHVPPIMHIPPPLWFAAAFFAGWGMEFLVPLAIHFPAAAGVVHAIGFALLVCGGLLGVSCFGIFLAARTTFIPFGEASKLVTRGPYRISRNPMYVSLVLAYLGGVGLLAQPWPLLFLPVPLVVLNRIVIPFEEARLRKAFDGAYDAYCATVRRWL